jgi:hypothetical protein
VEVSRKSFANNDAGPKGIQLGKEVAVGHFGSWKMPNFMIRFSRKTLFTENLAPLVDGSLSTWL